MMAAGDEEAVMAMMRQFYSSPAVLSSGSEEIFRNDIAACLAGGPWLEGYVFEEEGVLMGYAMVAKTFNCEYGKPCKWIEDLFVLPAFRGRGIGGRFLEHIGAKYPESLLRLEAEEENEGAMALYRRHGFDVLPYLQMKKNS